jgi:hypothetical protein
MPRAQKYSLVRKGDGSFANMLKNLKKCVGASSFFSRSFFLFFFALRSSDGIELESYGMISVRRTLRLEDVLSLNL